MSWHNIITPEDLRGKKLTIIDAIKLIEEKCACVDKKLVIRDFALFDFMGLPGVRPPFRFLLFEILSYNFEIIRLAIVRHPIDQWLSIRKSVPVLQVPLDIYLKGYLEYCKQIRRVGFVRYEDFTEYPKEQMRFICDKLQLEYDDNFQTRWFSFNKITGDTDERGAHSRGAGLNKIMRFSRPQIEHSTLSQFRANRNYWEALEILGYEE
jgi:hypothetical protein